MSWCQIAPGQWRDDTWRHVALGWQHDSGAVIEKWLRVQLCYLPGATKAGWYLWPYGRPTRELYYAGWLGPFRTLRAAQKAGAWK